MVLNEKIYNLTDEDVNKVEALFTDMNMHKSIISEIVQTNPTMNVNDTQAYSELLVINKKYNDAIADVIDKYTEGKYDLDSNWHIKFRDKILIIRS